jgi:hypothetical protein
MSTSETSEPAIRVVGKMPFGLPEEYTLVSDDDLVINNMRDVCEYDETLREESVAYLDWIEYWDGIPDIALFSVSYVTLTEAGLEAVRQAWYTFLKLVFGVEDEGKTFFEVYMETDWEARNALGYTNYYLSN